MRWWEKEVGLNLLRLVLSLHHKPCCNRKMHYHNYLLSPGNTNKRHSKQAKKKHSTNMSIPSEMISAATLQLMKMDIGFSAASFSPQESLASYSCSNSSQDSASSCISKSKVGGLSRSRCMSNLSALGGKSSETSIPRQASYKSSPNQPWGYFVDTPRT